MTPSSPQHHLRALDAATDHIRGPADAVVTLVEYGDFECPSCSQAYPAVKMLLARFGDRLRFGFRHFPLREVHPHADAAAQAAEAAGAQGQFWPYYDLLFSHHRHLDAGHLRAHAQALGLDQARFDNELADSVYLQRVQEHIDSGVRAGVRGTPSFFVNGRYVDVSFGLQHLEQAIAAAASR